MDLRNIKKCLHVTASMDPRLGGVSQAIRTLADPSNYSDNVILHEVASLDDPAALFPDTPFILYKLGPAKSPWAYSAKLIPWLREHAIGYDIIVIHGLWLFHGFAVRKVLDSLVSSQEKVPTCFLMPHGMLDPYFQKDPSRRIKALRNWFYWKFIEHRVINKSNGLLFTCEEERNLARQSFENYHPSSEHVVGLGITRPPDYASEMKTAFLEQCPELESETPYLLFLSRIHEKKGVDLLILAYAQLLLQGNLNLPDLVIAGPIDSEYALEMKKLAAEQLKETWLFTKIHFPGMIQGQAKWGAFYGCEAFILPSHQENFGIAVVEALACGAPVLITKKVNIWKEIIANGGGIAEDNTLAGILFSLSNWFSLSEDEKDNMMQNAYKTFNKYFTIKSTSRRLNKVISNQ